MFRLSSPIPSQQSLPQWLPLLAGSIVLNILLTPGVFAEATNPASTTGPAVTESSEPNIIEPAVSSVQVTSLQIEPGSGNIALQTTGAFLAPVLDVSAWPSKLTITLPDTSLDAEFSNTPDYWLPVLKNVMPEATNIQVGSNTAPKPAVTITLIFQGLAADAPKPQVLLNTGALLTVGLRPYDPEVSRKGVSKMMSSLVGLSNVPTAKPVTLNSLYAYFASIDPTQESTTKLDGLVFQAWKEFLAGNDGNAILALRPYVDRVPDDTAARYLLASAYMASGEYTTADKELTALLLQHQDSLPIVSQLIQVKLMAPADTIRDDKTIQPLLQEALKHWPNVAALHYAQGKYTLASGSLDSARQQILQAITLDPKPDYYNLLGDLELRAGNPTAARVAYLDALALQPSDPESRVKLAVIENSANNTTLALKDYAKVFSPSWLLNYAKALEDNGQNAQALAALKMADLSLGDVKNYTLIDRNKPVVYELGMRFADFKENADAQRNLKLFLELSNLKPDPHGSESAKRVPAAKEMLQHLASNVPAQSRTSASRSASKKSTVAAKTKMPAVKPAPAKESAATTPAVVEKTDKAEKADRNTKQETKESSLHAKPKEVPQEAHIATPSKQSQQHAETVATPTPSTPAAINATPLQQAEKTAPVSKPVKAVTPPATRAVQPLEAQKPVAPSDISAQQQNAATNTAAPAKVHIPAIQPPEAVPASAITSPNPETKIAPVTAYPTSVNTSRPQQPLEPTAGKSIVVPEAQTEAKLEASPGKTEAVSPSVVKTAPKEHPVEPTAVKPVSPQEPATEAKIEKPESAAPVTLPAVPPAPPQGSLPTMVQPAPVSTQAETTTNTGTPPSTAKPVTLDPLPGAKQMESIPSPYYPQSGTFE